MSFPRSPTPQPPREEHRFEHDEPVQLGAPLTTFYFSGLGHLWISLNLLQINGAPGRIRTCALWFRRLKSPLFTSLHLSSSEFISSLETSPLVPLSISSHFISSLSVWLISLDEIRWRGFWRRISRGDLRRFTASGSSAAAGRGSEGRRQERKGELTGILTLAYS